MRGKDYCNIITHNAKRVTSPCGFRRCCAVIYYVTSVNIHIPVQYLLKYKGYELCRADQVHECPYAVQEPDKTVT